LGDSYAQGQGAEPWFRLISPEIDKLGHQGINGGIMGTGFEQCLKYDRYLQAGDVRVRKVAVLFISDDFYRHVWNFTPSRLQCLASWDQCGGEERPLYRLPPTEDFSSWTNQIKTNRAPLTKVWLKERVAKVLPVTINMNNFLRKKTMDMTSSAPDQSHGLNC